MDLLAQGKVRDIYAAARTGCCWSPPTASPPTTWSIRRRSPTRARCSPGCRRSGSTAPSDICPNHLISYTEVPDEAAAAPCWSSGSRCSRSSASCAATSPGSGWKDYQATGAVCGIELPDGPARSPSSCPSRSSRRRRRPRWATTTRTWTSTAPPRSWATAPLLEELRRLSIELYALARRARARARDHPRRHQVRVRPPAPTARSCSATRCCTPDSSRFWPADGYEPGRGQPTFDKQYVRDWAAGSGWDKSPPAPALPDGGRRRHPRALRRGLRADHRRAVRRAGSSGAARA